MAHTASATDTIDVICRNTFSYSKLERTVEELTDEKNDLSSTDYMMPINEGPPSPPNSPSAGGLHKRNRVIN